MIIESLAGNPASQRDFETAAAREMHGSGEDSVVAISDLDKTYASGHRALKSINLTIRRGEIFALLGPNGAGKTTLIGVLSLIHI